MGNGARGVRLRTPVFTFSLYPIDNNLHPSPLRHDTMPDSQDLFIQAVELVELGQLEDALALFQTLLKTDSNNATLWNNIGIIRFRQGEYRDAVNAFSQAADTDPEFKNACLTRVWHS